MAQQQKMKEDAEDEQRKHLGWPHFPIVLISLFCTFAFRSKFQSGTSLENEIQVHLKKKEELQKAEKKKLQTRSSDDDEDSDLEKNFKKITVAVTPHLSIPPLILK